MKSWQIPALCLLLSLVLLVVGWHDRWVAVVWDTRGSPAQSWNSSFTLLRLGLDAALLMCGGLGSALLVLAARNPLLAFLLLLFCGLLSGFLAAPLWAAALVGLLMVLAGVWTFRGQLPVLIGLGVLWGMGLLQLLTHPAVPIGHPRYPLDVWGVKNLGLYGQELVLPALTLVVGLHLLVRISLLVLDHLMHTATLLVNRLLVFLGMSLLIALLYILVVSGLGALLGTLTSTVVASVLVAVLAQPVQMGLQHSINRIMYGDRNDPYQVMQTLGKNLAAPSAPRAQLQDFLNTLLKVFRVPHAAIQLQTGETLQSGLPAGQQLHFELVVQGERIGTLVLSSPEKPRFRDLLLLQNLARQVALTAQSLQLQQQLKDSREQLVRAGEAERKRLRRDLHDGLGPALAGLSLKLEASRLQLQHAPDKLEQTLKQLKDDSQELILDVRRLVHDLRPPRLDDLGLRAALLELLERCAEHGMHTQHHLPEVFPALGAALEVALYRITQEALTNVMKHAQASGCSLCLQMDEKALMLEVRDDGVGLPGTRTAGVGTHSMRERAEALSGSLRWERLNPGTALIAVFPLDPTGALHD
ncbi:sensor histidine kinase [Deinococcus roseus]|uniref:histidine kinase n=1 Tax=Deinococcus roseus TaxID=392414 RepID=A0ABQ2D0L6_9DEIO|nr:sensor histidine kinase [Deinococcus roseus]GGJ39114.1 hypothetical protein GCM10008938_26400 [Deinococcus roseus]